MAVIATPALRLLAAAVNAKVETNRLTVLSDAGAQLTMLLSDDPDITLPVGVWGSSSRLRQGPARWYQADDDGAITLALAIDTRLIGGPSMARRLQVLQAFGTRAEGAQEPPKLRVAGGDMTTLANRTWIMTAGSLGKRVVAGGQHVRQELSLTLEPWAPFAGVQRIQQGRTRDSAGRRRTREIRSKSGDTLRAIAVRQLGSAGQWKALRDWNPKLAKVDPDAPLRTGTKVMLK